MIAPHRHRLTTIALDLLLLIVAVQAINQIPARPWRYALFPFVTILLAVRCAQRDKIAIAPLILALRSLASGFKDFAWTTALWLPLYLGVTHLVLKNFFGWSLHHDLRWPPLSLLGLQLFCIALPEEIFYRGYLQTALQQIFPDTRRIKQFSFGLAWPLTAALFALSHSLIQWQWWHFAIFFPGLLFGFLRSYSNNIIAGTLAHATSNLAMWWIVNNYS